MTQTNLLHQIHDAQKVLATLIPKSPLLKNNWLTRELGCEVYLKLENMLPIGSFKIRGATYKISRLSAADKKKGVICASAGNHAQGVAWGARQLGTSALIVMPKTAPIMKIHNTQSLGAEIKLHGESYDDAFAEAQRIAQETGRIFVHAFEDDDVIAGQGTVGLEIHEQLPDVDAIVCAIGGGGLLSGTALALKSLKPSVEIVGCQATGAPSMIKSLRAGHAVQLDSIHTFADGIAVKKASDVMRKHLEPYVNHLVDADDEEIASAVVTLLEKAKTIAEGAGALPLAALRKCKDQFKGKKVVLIIGGGNIDINLIARIIDRGLILAGRRIRLNVVIPDKPGSLARLTDLIAKQGGNVIQAIHDRNEPSTKLNETDVALTLETRGPEHSDELIAALREHGFHFSLIT